MAEKPLYSGKDKSLVAQRMTTQRINKEVNIKTENQPSTPPTELGAPLNSPLRKV